MRYELDKIPFSRYGSYFVISKDSASENIYVRDLHGGDEAPSLLYELCVAGHTYEQLRMERTETMLSFYVKEKENCCLKMVFGEEDTIYFSARGVTVLFRAVGGKYDTLVPLENGKFEHHLYAKQRKVLFTVLEGAAKQEQEWNVIGSKDAVITLNPPDQEGIVGESEGVMQCYLSVAKERKEKNFSQAAREAERSYQEWENHFPVYPTYRDSRKLAAYITWCNFVHKEGTLTSDAMYMSKNWMFNIWSWDNCFGGIALSESMPELAYGQFQVFFDSQDESGAYPDYVNETFASYNCVKPPIHAWAYRKMMRENSYFSEQKPLKRAYESFCKVVRYWENHRQNDNAVFPVYYHGNDSGWDNASVFHQGFPVESPDLGAFLIQKMDILSELAQKLGRFEESRKWKEKADELFPRFLKRFFRNGRFYAWYTPNNSRIEQGNSLLMYLPIILAYRMEKEMADQLVKQLEEQFETPYGLATEQPDSEQYKKGGYWLGPVWAPTTYLFIDALRENGYTDMAKRLADKFLEVTKIGLMSENYDPFTGEGYDDPAFAWPSCVFLQLQKEFKE